MPTFQILKADRATKADADAVKIKKQIDDLKKAKGDKKQIAKLEKDHTVVAKTLVQILTQDIKIAADGLKKLDQLVEAAVGTAAKRLAAARTGMKEFQKRRDESLLRPCTGLGGEVERLEKQADTLMTEFAVSWNEYRQPNFKGVDANLLKDFSKTRAAIIDRTILIRSKQQKLVSLTAEAGTIETAAVEAVQDFETDTDNRLAQAIELRETVNKVIVQGKKKNDPNLISRALPGFKEWSGLPFKEFKGQVAVRKSQYKSLTTVAQVNNQAVSSLKRSITNGKQMFSAEDLKDDKVAEVMGEIDKTFAEYESTVRTNLKALPEVAKLLTEADKRVKAGR